MKLRAHLFLPLAMVLVLSGCAADSASDDASPGAETGDDQDVKALLLGEESDGKSVKVVAGRSFTVALADNRASSGFGWTVASAPASLGAPKTSYLAPPSSAPGSAGTARFTWKTTGAVQQLGKRAITFALSRSWEPQKPSRTITITVEIVDGKRAATCGGLAGRRCNGASEYCEYPSGTSCGASEPTGTCQPRPDVCTAQFLPVCGCDGKTHSNACIANAAGVSVLASGACK